MRSGRGPNSPAPRFAILGSTGALCLRLHLGLARRSPFRGSLAGRFCTARSPAARLRLAGDEYGFDLVAEGVEHEGTIVVRPVVGPWAGRAVVARAILERGLVEAMHGVLVFRPKAVMRAVSGARAFLVVGQLDPEFGDALTVRDGVGQILRRALVAQCAKHRVVELRRARYVGNADGNMMQHVCALCL